MRFTGSPIRLANYVFQPVELPLKAAFQAAPGDEATEEHRPPDPETHGVPSDSFTGYAIVREIHRGGQGVVYQAIQKATKRKVAIKVMREGPFAGARDKARFEREVEILGQLNHPNIVAIHDSGMAAGSFYFVMDYISGQPLDVWMASGQRTIEETLKLVREDLRSGKRRPPARRDPPRPQARQHPHRHQRRAARAGLRPGQGGRRARRRVAAAGDDGDRPVRGQPAVGQPGAGRGHPGQDRHPHGRVLAGRDPVPDADRQVPVRRGGQHAGRAGPDHEERTRPGPSTIRKQINDEVETIVLKCLSKERERRYQTAGELARDVGHYLAGEPIEAKRDSTFYVLKKSLGRHTWQVAVAAVFLLMLLAGVATSTTLWRRATSALARESQQRAIAQARTTEAQRSRAEALVSQERAEQEKERAEVSLYRASIMAARNAIEGNRFAQARELLWDCSERYRHWEWGWAMLQCNLDLMTLRGHSGTVWAALFSPDGKAIVTAGQDGTIRVWDGSSGEPLRMITEKGESVNALAFSPDGRFLASGSGAASSAGDNAVQLWDFQTGRLIRTMKGHSGRVLSLAFTPDSRFVVSGSADWTARLWSVPGGEPIRRLEGHRTEVRCVACDPKGRVLATVGYDDNVLLWDLGTYKSIRSFRPSGWATAALAFSPDGRFLLTAGQDGAVRVWDVSSGRFIHQWGANTWFIWSLAFSPDGTLLATSSREIFPRMFAVDSSRTFLELRGHEAITYTSAFSPDGKRLLTAGEDGTAKVWKAHGDLGRQEFFMPVKGVWPYITSISAAPDGKSFAVAVHGSTSAFVCDFDSMSGPKALGPHGKPVAAVALSPDGRFLAIAADGIWIRDVSGGMAVVRKLQTSGTPASLSYSRDSRLLAAGCSKGHIGLFDLSSGRRVQPPINAHSETVRALAFSPDGDRIASGCGNGEVRLWNSSNGKMQWQLNAGSSVEQLVFSPDGKLLAIGVSANNPPLCDVAAGRLIGTLKGHTDGAWGVCFSPDGKRIATAGVDGTVRLWSPETLRELLSVRYGNALYRGVHP